MKKYVYSSAVGLVLGALAFHPCAEATKLGDFERELDITPANEWGGLDRGLRTTIRRHCLEEEKNYGIERDPTTFERIFPQAGTLAPLAHELGRAYVSVADSSMEQFDERFEELRRLQKLAIEEGIIREDTQSPPPPATAKSAFYRGGAAASGATEEEEWRERLRVRCEEKNDSNDEFPSYAISAQLTEVRQRQAERYQQHIDGAATAAGGGGADLEEDRVAALSRLEEYRMRGAPVEYDDEEASDSRVEGDYREAGGAVGNLDEDLRVEAMVDRIKKQRLASRAPGGAAAAEEDGAEGTAEDVWLAMPQRAPGESFSDALRGTQREEAQRREQAELARVQEIQERNRAEARARQDREEAEVARGLAAAGGRGAARDPLPPSYSEVAASVPAALADEAAIIEALKDMEREQLGEVGEHAWQPSLLFLEKVTPGLGKKPIAEAKRIALQILREPAGALPPVAATAAPIARPVAVHPAGAAGGGGTAPDWEKRMEDEKATLNLLKAEEREKMRTMGDTYEPSQFFLDIFLPETRTQFMKLPDLLQKVRDVLAEE